MDLGLITIQCLERAVSSDHMEVREAEAKLKQLEETNRADFVSVLLTIVGTTQPLPLTGSVSEELIKVMAAIYLKNYQIKNWFIDARDGGCSEAERRILKSQIVEVTLHAPRRVKAQLYESLSSIASTDFPTEWESLLPSITVKYFNPYIQSCQQNSPFIVPLKDVSTCLDILAKCTRKYRALERNDEVLYQLKSLLDQGQEVFIGLFKCSAESFLSSCASGFGVPPTATSGLDKENFTSFGINLTGQNDCVMHGCLLKRSLEVLTSIQAVDLPEYFENALPITVNTCLTLLRMQVPKHLKDDQSVESDQDPDSRPTLGNEVKNCCVEFLTSYAEKYQEEFQPYISESSRKVYDCVTSCSREPSDDELAKSCMNFLAVASATRWDSELNPFLSDPTFLVRICDNVIGSSLALRKEDADQIEDNPWDFVRYDLEGADRGSRREASMKLIKVLVRHHESAVSNKLLEMVQALDSKAASDITGWTGCLGREAALFLVSAIAIRVETRAQGVLEVSKQFEINSFFEKNVYPLLQLAEVVPSGSSDAALQRDLLCASGLKFTATFRNQIPTQIMLLVIPLIIKHITSESLVLQTYAAFCLERILTVKDPMSQLPPSERPLKFNVNDSQIKHVMETACIDLMAVMLKGSKVNENEYLVKCIWRILISVKLEPAVALNFLKQFSQIVDKIAASPSNPVFTHYLFEVLAYMSRSVSLQTARSSPSVYMQVHMYVLQCLIPLISQVEPHDFVPYCYQVLAGIIDTIPNDFKKEEAPETAQVVQLYDELFKHLLEQEKWLSSTGNIPGLFRLIGSYISSSSFFGPIVTSQDRVLQILTRFQFSLRNKRVPLPATFRFLKTILIHLKSARPLYGELLKVLLDRVQNAKTDKLVSLVVVALSTMDIILAKDENYLEMITNPSVQQPQRKQSVKLLLDAIQSGLADNFISAVVGPACIKPGIKPKGDRLIVLGFLGLYLSEPISAPYLRSIESVCSAVKYVAEGESAVAQRTEPMGTTAEVLEEPPEEFTGSYNALSCASEKFSLKNTDLVSPDQVLSLFNRLRSEGHLNQLGEQSIHSAFGWLSAP